MRTACRLFIAAIAVTLFATAAARAATETPAPMAPTAPACGAPGALTHLDRALARTRARLAAGKPLKIVAFGSSSTAGNGASSPAHSYPSRLEAALRALLPDHDIVVVNRGIAGEDAEEMLARLRRSVLAEHPDLVIWQVGTNAVLGDYAFGKEARLIRQGLHRLLAAGIDVILLDPQYAPQVLVKPAAGRMVSLLARIGQAAGVGVFHRFSIMRHWRERQNLPFTQFISGDGLHMNDWSYECTAKLLAGAIVEAATRPAPAPVMSAIPRSRKTRA